MIPKKVHYCWFGRGKKSQKLQDCIDSWKKYLPDYEIKEWNEDNFDVNAMTFTKEAYAYHKWAFVADVARLHALYTEGGIYFDTDVEVVKNFDDLLDNKAFTGFEDSELLQTGVLGAEKGHPWIGYELEGYKHKAFISKTGKFLPVPNTHIMTHNAVEHGLKFGNQKQVIWDGVMVYPRTYFAPYSWKFNDWDRTDETHAIHHFAGDWDKPRPWERRAKKYMGKLGLFIYQLSVMINKAALKYYKIK